MSSFLPDTPAALIAHLDNRPLCVYNVPMEKYKLPLNTATAEFTEKKSRFISNISPVSSEEEALAYLNSVRGKHREATHNVYAYRIKKNGACRHNDDGEPSGAAGMPLLDTFLKQDIFDFCCVATRYFGGVMLGAGGLVRAYSRCGAVALEASGVGLMREIALCSVEMPYALFDVTKRLLLACGAIVTSEDFGAGVVIRFSLPPEDLPALERCIAESTAGSVLVNIESIELGVI